MSCVIPVSVPFAGPAPITVAAINVMARYRYNADKGEATPPETLEEREEREHREQQEEAERRWQEEQRLREERRVGAYL